MPSQITSDMSEALKASDESQSTQTPNPATPACLFLNKLPGELRNAIYELAIDVRDEQANDKAQINFMKAKPPTKDLLLTNRQIYNEAKGLYKTAYRNFWMTTNFIVDRELGEYTLDDLQALQASDISRITSLTVVHRRKSGVRYTSTLIDPRGVWLIERVSPEEFSTFCVPDLEWTGENRLLDFGGFSWHNSHSEEGARMFLAEMEPQWRTDFYEVVLTEAWDAMQCYSLE